METEPVVRVTITEARRLLPALLKRVHDDPGLRVEITVRDEPVAELRAVTAATRPGQAVRRLLALRARLAAGVPEGASTDVSSRVKEYLYLEGPGGTQ